MEEGFYVVGIDGGGTKTEAVLVDEHGRVVSSGIGGPSNPNGVSPEAVFASLRDAVGGALAGAENGSRYAVAATCVGMAGSRGHHGLIRDVAAKLGVGKRVVIVSDVVIAFWGVIAKALGVVVIAGTGSSAYGVSPQGDTADAGGWGYLIGDEGGGYDIGRAGIMAAVRAYDGRGPATALQERLLAFFRLETMRQILPQIYHPSGGDSRMPIAKFAPIVVRAASEGDAVSRDILERAGHQLGLTAVAVVRKLALCDREFDLGLVGSVFKAGDLVIRPLRDVVLEVAPQARIFVSHRPPVLGAARLALREIGRDVVVEAGRSDFVRSSAV